jgi:hypothetical protein
MANEVGSTLRYYNRDTLTWSTGTDVSESDIKAIINMLYQDEVFPRFVQEHPSYYKKTGYFNSWITTGTVDATATSTTLVATSSIFTNSMADQRLYVYNSTDGASAIIEGYTSGTTVTVDTDISSWVGDTIYVLGQEFSFGGDGTDHWTTTEVSMKYDTSTTVYTPAVKVEQEHLFVSGNEVGNELSPQYYDTTLLISSVWTSGLGVFPKFDTKITNAIRVVRTAKPGVLGDSDSPRLPVTLPLINGAIAWAKRQMGGGEFREYQDYQALYKAGIEESLRNWRPDRSNFPKIIRTSSRMKFRRKLYR